RFPSSLFPFGCFVFRRFITGAFVIGMLVSTNASAHPVSRTSVYLNLNATQAEASVRISLEDLYWFQDLVGDDQDHYARSDILEALQRHGETLRQKLQIRNADGETIPAEFVRSTAEDIPAEGIDFAFLSQFGVTYLFQYATPEKPEHLTFAQYLSSETLAMPPLVDWTVYQEGAGSEYVLELRPDEPATVRFDWEQLPPSSDTSEERVNAWLERQKQAMLGITNYSESLAFVYVDRSRIRLELLIPLSTLETKVPIEKRDPSFLEIDEQAAAADALRPFLLSLMTVSVNEHPLDFAAESVRFFGVSPKDFANPDQVRRIGTANARVGTIFSADLPVGRHVDVQWNVFSKFIRSVRLFVYLPDQTLQHRLAAGTSQRAFQFEIAEPPGPSVAVTSLAVAPEYAIQPPSRTRQFTGAGLAVTGAIVAFVSFFVRRTSASLGTVGLVAGLALLLGGGVLVALPISPPSLSIGANPQREIVHQLLDRMYDAFAFRSESESYDALAQSAQGPLVEKLYLNVRRSLADQQQGNELAEVRDVQLLESTPIERFPDGFAVQCRWSIRGVAEHWGHVHERTNEFAAQATVQIVDGSWKLTQLETQRESEVESSVSLRGL
ncbi:MAG: hypothetical protein KDA60_09970, partial [Planctomycetales bacterium]|nr:hypothetical protein [Planctomycetales bacterium]